MKICNISGYFFTHLSDLMPLKDHLKTICQQNQLKGTIILSSEGINISLAGEKIAAQQFMDLIHADTRFSTIEFKLSYSAAIPFRRLYIKCKQEIISAGNISAKTDASSKIKPNTLKQWLDEKRDFNLIDTRNDYETNIGAFVNAKKLPLKHFRNFADVIAMLPKEDRHKPTVIYCTGGIRCEKALPTMLEHGFKEVYQLDGGILKYFIDCGASHYEGECFVFDDRVALDANLQATGTVLCKKCQIPTKFAEICDSCIAQKNKIDAKKSGRVIDQLGS